MITKLVLPFTSLVVLGLVIYQVEPPKSWGQANFSQWIMFYIPLLALLTSLLNLLIKEPVKSLVIAIGLTLLVILQGLDSLTIITGPLVLIGIVVILRSINRPSNLPRHQKTQRLIKLKRQR